jgi:PncC family amidohydrolase
MESCTGGQVASVLTDAPGATQHFAGGAVTYTIQQKVDAGVLAEIIATHGVVSPETAMAMAGAAKEKFDSAYGLSTTGVLGPEPLEGVEPGTVYIGIATPSGGQHFMLLNMRQGERAAIKRRTVTTALQMLRRALIGELD